MSENFLLNLSQLGHDKCLHLNFFGCLAVTGDNASTFLQGQLTCDVSKISTTQASLGACCDHKGRMLANFWIYLNSPDKTQYYLLLPREMIPKLQSHLQRFAVFSKVNLQDVSNDYAFLALHDYLLHENLPTDGTQQCVAQENIFIINIATNPPRYLCIVAKKSLPENSIHKTEISNDENQWQLANIHSGLVVLQQQTSELFIPQMINLEKWQGVSFQKGCFVGQEIVARTEYLGKLKRHLYRAEINSSIAVNIGDEIIDEEQQVTGVVVCAALTAQKNISLLCVLQDQSAEKELYVQKNQLLIHVSLVRDPSLRSG